MKSKISVTILLLSSFAFPNEPVKIISSDFRSILIEFTPQYFETTEHIINNQKFLSVGFTFGYSPSDKWGEPAIQEYNLNVGVPSETGNTIEVLNSIYTELDGKIIPIPKMVKDGTLNRFEYELNENYYNYNPSEELAAFGEFGIMREIKKQSIRIFPVKFDPAVNKIKLYTKIIFRINFAPSAIFQNEQKDDLASGVIVNYDVAQHWKKDTERMFKGNLVTNSVLAQGTWVRFEAPQEGFYKITRSMLASYGIDAATVDPRTIKIYNNGGKILPENPVLPRPVDLVENAIWVIGEEDGRFDENDYILFYGSGNSFWDYDTSSGTIKRYFHLYSKENFYWITSGGVNGKRIQEKPGLNTAPGYIQTSTQAFADWDIDKINIGQSGRISVGDVFSQSATSRVYMNNLDNRIASFPINYNFRFVNASPASYPLKVDEINNPTPIFNITANGYGAQDHIAGVEKLGSFSITGPLNENRSSLKFEITPSAVTSVGYLDYFEIRYQKELKPTNNYLLFFSNDTTATIEYQLANFPNTNIKVFDITDYANVKNIVPLPNWPSGGEFRFQVSETKGYVSKYLAVGNDDFKSPSNPVKLDENSNLRGETEGARFIIITHKNFMAAADRLKDYRIGQSKVPISTIVVDIQKIFNEFSGGILDVSGIRDYIKYAYDNWTIKPEYVLFFGSGNYDYKNIEGYNTNFIPTWQTVESLSLLDSYTTDDFYVQVAGFDNVMDLATGRITVKNLIEANRFVDKIIDYENNSDIGLWRNLITLVADDIYTSTGSESNLHTPQSEQLSNRIPDYYDINKIYMVNYPVVLTGSGKRMPEVNKAIINSVNQGNLILNYIGHGNPELWAHEVVFDRNVSIPQFRNQNKYFFLVAATCSFGYFDIPNFRAASEDMLFLENAGAIASLTASRLVFSQPNASYTFSYYTNLLTSRDSNGYSITLGKANLITKSNGFTDTNSQKYFIFGDPTLRLVIPKYQANIDSINGQSTTSVDIQLKALGKVNLNGIIKRLDNLPWADYSGEGILNVYDSERSQTYNANPSGTSKASFIIPGGLIFRGRLSITNGKFNADFVVPKDISYENRKGKIVFYFYSNNEDGVGFSDKIIVGGTDSSAVNDGAGPEIEIYFDDPSYSNTYLINPDSKLIVKLFDDTGINTTGTGVGHQLEGILNDNEAAPIDFSGFFTGDLDAGGRSGEINYTFDGLETGDYKLDVKAWDVFNNFSTEEAYFSVVSGNDLVIRDVYNYPNPFTSSTTFTFQQNLNSSLNVEVKVYTIAGRLIKAIKKDNIAERFVTIDWDGRDDDGDQLGNGAYLYKLNVKTTDGQYSKSILGKLAVIR